MKLPGSAGIPAGESRSGPNPTSPAGMPALPGVSLLFSSIVVPVQARAIYRQTLFSISRFVLGVITSDQNQFIQKARKVLTGQRRAYPNLCAVEGVKVAQEALDADVAFDLVLFSEVLAANPQGLVLLQELERRAVQHLKISPPLMVSLSEVAAHQGVLALVHRPLWPDVATGAISNPWLVMLIGIQDPGNAGTILRTCEAVGITEVLACQGTVDLFNAKCIRASMGSVFRVPLQAHWSLERTLAFLKRNSIRLIGAGARQGTPYAEADLTGPLALAFGGEGGGLPKEVRRAADELVCIPMAAPVDSLNVATSAAILLYEARRQRLSGTRSE
ncbi:MAG: RNA methyltransferase [Acidobacteria bacterium]|nr:RNA methyltransferase [Acidobacteriota bacterium]MBI3658710.1 RNA methyltransferase [Acidobacteriota bacterium]